MDSLKQALEPYRKTPQYGAIGVIICSIPWIILKKITDRIAYLDAKHLRRTLLAFIFIGAYVYMWTQGINPHDAEVKENNFSDELPLLLAGGYFLVHPDRDSCRRTIHDLLTIFMIVLSIVQGEIAAITNTYLFLVEAPNVFLMLCAFFENLHLMALTWILKRLSVIIYFLSNIDICNLGHHVLVNEKLHAVVKLTFLLQMAFQFLDIIDQVNELRCESEDFYSCVCSRKRSKMLCSRSRQRRTGR